MDPTIPQNYLQYAMAREDASGDPNAKNPTPGQTSSGQFGFTDETANAVATQHPELGLKPRWQNDPAQAPIGMKAFTQDNANILAANNRPVNSTTLYLAHHFGAQGAMKALDADVSAPVSSVFGDKVMAANPDLKNKRIGDLTGYSPSMADPTQQQQQPALAQAMQPQQPQPSTLFGGNPTPVGGLAAIARMLGIGSEPELGRHLQNAGAALIGISDPKGGAALQEAANQPHFNVVNDAMGNRYAIDTRTGQPISKNGGPMTGVPGAQSASDPVAAVAQSPNAQNELGIATAKASSEKMDALEKAASAAQGLIDQNKQLKTLSQDPSIVQGPGIWNMMKEKLSENTNGSLGGVDVAKQADFDKGNSSLVGANLSAMPGIRVAAPEIKFGSMASADSEKPAAANQQIYDNNIANAQRVIDARDIARQHFYGKTPGVLGSAYSAALQDYQDKHPVYQETTIKPNAGGPATRTPLSAIFK